MVLLFTTTIMVSSLQQKGRIQSCSVDLESAEILTLLVYKQNICVSDRSKWLVTKSYSAHSAGFRLETKVHGSLAHAVNI